tara:strand:+ start:583 stop:732 length:150 start_codon:yes stop_codon:yes gene_type:complete
MSEQQDRQTTQEQISDLAEKYLNQALADGEPFREALCNWAIAKAEREVG